jgi:NAD(P)-dependent dehydrogenase (short-subunit alcohol dehydrogenase family)
LVEEVTECFFGPMRVSVLLDAYGAYTTAAAAVLAAARHLRLSESTALVLAATGPVGQRAVRLLAREGASVRVASRSRERAEAVCQAVRGRIDAAELTAWDTSSPEATAAALAKAQIVIAAGAAGIELLPADLWKESKTLRVAIDLNAVSPLGIAEVEVTDKAVERHGAICYGAIGVGGTKMKIHKAAIAKLFESNDQALDAEQVFAIGRLMPTSARKR